MNNKWDYGSLHPMVPNPYTLLFEISEQVKYFSVIGFLFFFFFLKDEGYTPRENYAYTKPAPTYDFKTIERIFEHPSLLPHLDSRLWGTCPAFI